MKYLVLYKQGPNPPAEAVNELAASSIDWVQRLMDDNKIETTYLFVDGGGFAVFNADSPEELQQLIASNPSSAFLRHEAHACLEAPRAEGLDTLKEGFGAALSLADQFAAGAAAGAPATAGLAPGKPSGAPVVPSPKEILDAIATYVASKSGAGKAGGAPGSSAGAAGKAGGTVGKAGGYSKPPGQ